MAHNGIKVLDIQQALSKIKPTDIIIVTVVDIQDIVKIIKSTFNNKWYSLSEFIDKDKLNQLIIQKKEDEFLNYSLEAMYEMHKSYLKNNNGLSLRSIDVMITEKCTLKCKDCANLMQFYEKPINIEKN